MPRSQRQLDLEDLRVAGEYLLNFHEHTWTKDSARALLWRAQDGLCACCSKPLHPTKAKTSSAATLDHVIPRTFNGRDALGNLVLLRHSCNQAKGLQAPTVGMLEALTAINALLGWPNFHHVEEP